MIKGNRRVQIALLLATTIFVVGASGYMLLEEYTLIDALYMVAITITTVGFGEVKTLSPSGRIFTIFLLLTSFGSLGFIGTVIAENILENLWKGTSGRKKMKKKIAALRKHYIICGFGRVGMTAADYLANHNAEFVVINKNASSIPELESKGYLYLDGDATHEQMLLDAGIKHAAGVLVLLGSDPDNLFIVLTARELNPMLHIISRVEDFHAEKRILRAGADQVSQPYASAGQQIASDILTATGVSSGVNIESCPLPLVPQWIEVQPGSSMIGKTLESISNQMAREVLGLRRGEKDWIYPPVTLEVAEFDQILVLDDRRDANPKQPEPVIPQKVVIIDDNPVILRLYVRLFQKSGFHALTATNGSDGLALILKEKPVAAVIDFMLPVLSGIEVCQKVRQDPECNAVKLILFTGDDKDETRQRALSVGVDQVVLKTPEAFEIIKTVIALIKKEA